VRGIDTASRRIELEHDPIATLQWPAMTRGFALLDATQAAHLQPGDAVEFDLRGEPSANHAYEIVRIAPRQR
jgi:Cu/Ag efflux protein CusF